MLGAWKKTKGYSSHLKTVFGTNTYPRHGTLGEGGRGTQGIWIIFVSHQHYHFWIAKEMRPSGIAETFLECGLVRCCCFSPGTICRVGIYFIFLLKAIWWARWVYMCVSSVSCADLFCSMVAFLGQSVCPWGFSRLPCWVECWCHSSNSEVTRRGCLNFESFFFVSSLYSIHTSSHQTIGSW